jgi:hypothetical protein
MTDPLNARGPESVGGSAAAVDEWRETMKSGGRVQARKDAACWLGCGRANITEAGTRGRRAVIAPRERKSRRTYTPRASPTRARALWIPGAMGRCRRGTPIWSKDGRLCACGLCPRASPARARALLIPGLEGTGWVARKLEAGRRAVSITGSSFQLKCQPLC